MTASKFIELTPTVPTRQVLHIHFRAITWKKSKSINVLVRKVWSATDLCASHTQVTLAGHLHVIVYRPCIFEQQQHKTNPDWLYLLPCKPGYAFKSLAWLARVRVHPSLHTKWTELTSSREQNDNRALHNPPNVSHNSLNRNSHVGTIARTRWHFHLVSIGLRCTRVRQVKIRQASVNILEHR